ncbi:hypothetical protein EPN28_00360 [Patescibacteria group bacterium]|nr:MAG: hypothetical protein EPN28_00360 [Patescibacteria group bacterium]
MFRTGIFSLLWGVVIFFSLLGWGWAALSLLRPRQKHGLGFKAALGLALSLIVGGVMNWLSAVSPKAVIIYLGLGVILLLFFVLRRWRVTGANMAKLFNDFKKDKIFALLFIGLVLILSYQYIVAAYTPANPLDDYQAYFVYSGEMLETGALGAQPFSDRRLTGALGGQSFLDTFVLAVLPYDYLNLFDRGLSWLVLILLVWELFRKFGASRRTAALATGSLALFSAASCNITGQITSTVLLLVFGQLFFEAKSERPGFWRRALFVALIIAALSSIKSNVIVIGFFYFIFYHWLSYRESVSRAEKIVALKSLLVSALAAFVLLLPWMILLYQSSGTLLYPIFGKGFHGSVYGVYALPYSRLTFANLLTLLYNLANVLFIILFFLLLFVWKSLPGPHNDGLRRRLKLIIWATVLTVAAIAFLTAGLSVFYYTFPIVHTAVILLLVIFAGQSENWRGYLTSWKYERVALAVSAIIFGAGLSAFLPAIKNNLGLIGSHLADRQFVSLKIALAGQRISGDFTSTAEERISYQKAQEAVPPTRTALARTEKPFLFDFRRNKIYIIDLPGGASLPPGMPSYQGGEALARYLLAKDIRYVIFAYATEVFPQSKYGDTVRLATNIWISNGAKVTFDFNDNLKELGQSRKRIFDDGKIFVLDLASLTKQKK